MSRSADHTRGVVLLVLTTLVWGTTFPIVKEAVRDVSPAALIVGRFVVAVVAFLPWLRFASRHAWRDGAVLGVALFASFVTQVIGLQSVPAGRAAFITGLNAIIVPLLGPLLGRRVPRVVVVAAALAVSGIGVLSWEGGRLGVGDAWVFGCAVAYAAYVLLLERFAVRHAPMVLTAVQLFVVSALGAAWVAPELAARGAAVLPASSWAAVLYLGVVATAATTLVQAVAQRSVPAFETAVIYSLEPVFAAVFSYFMLGESLGPRGLAGAAMVLAATVLSQLPSPRRAAVAD